MKIVFVLLFFMVSKNSMSQDRNSVWCFGDSALVDFSDTSNIVVGTSSIDSRGSCASISNEMGNILFYGATRANLGGITTQIFDSSNNLMLNGDSIYGEAWYHELVIVPNPKSDSTFYLFTIGVTSFYGLHYNIIDMRLNNGLGAVVLKNQQLNTFEQVDCLTAIKHGNGRDWWIISRKSDFSTGGSNNDWYIYLVTPDTIQAMPVQSLGAQIRTNSGRLCFTKTGDKLAFTNLLGVLDIFDFDRCSGILSNPSNVEIGVSNPPAPFNWSCAFSGDESKLYIATNDTLSFLFQYDLNAPNIATSKDTLWSTNFPKYACGALKLAPDNKIYLSNWYYNGFQNSYPYPDSMYNMYNMNLSVINQPDSLGVACDFQPYSFYLGGKRTYVGLPNNPDYELGPLAGSPCDTLVSINEPANISTNANLDVYYAPDWEKAFINANKLKGKNYRLRMVDVLGKAVYTENGSINSLYFTKDLNCASFAKGMYIVDFETENEKLTKKFVIE